MKFTFCLLSMLMRSMSWLDNIKNYFIMILAHHERPAPVAGELSPLRELGKQTVTSQAEFSTLKLARTLYLFANKLA